ncbi:carboxypeptidase regulatory-like domain-containing protein [Dysgonomonas sp. ZJ709]|uniref:carboxypeptidase regulatory-like domain-containing protein n=1 Tax=Dysgonomonas sp. ZJ709 TaxID=2709797 RepID=UPI0013ED0FB6|nr:carboxypeptidase regulatory-like domain-containing protein [Dysgonomonas sp. ZJ709]
MRNAYCLIIVTSVLLFLILGSCTLDDVYEPVLISGTITDSLGVKLSGVMVKIESTSDNRNVETSSDGTYSITLSQGGTSYLVFTKEGYTSLSRNLSLKGGEQRILDLKMATLAEDAYLNIGVKDTLVTNKKGEMLISAATNIHFEITCDADWVTLEKWTSTFTIKYDENKTLEERTATIELKGEYGLVQTMKVTQMAGPVLAILDYIGKDGKTDFLTTNPFLSFNREVKLLSASSSNNNGMDLTPQYSADNKTIHFPNLRVSLFESVTLSYVVESTDKARVIGNFEVKAYDNSIDVSNISIGNILFTKDNKYFWMLSSEGYETSALKQYSAVDMTLMKTIPKNSVYGNLAYNSYNNCLYLTNQAYFDSSDSKIIDVYNASTGAFVKKLDLSNNLGTNTETSFELVFGNNGLGLMPVYDYSGTYPSVTGKIYYVDSSKNHACGSFSSDPALYFEHQPTTLEVRPKGLTNGGKTIVMHGENGSGNSLFAIDTETKRLTSYTSLGGGYIYTANLSNGVLSFSGESISYIDFSANKKTSLALKQSAWQGCVLNGKEGLPVVLTNSLSMIDMSKKQEVLFSHNGNTDGVYTSPDGSIVLIRANNKLYHFKSEVFTKYNAKLKQL